MKTTRIFLSNEDDHNTLYSNDNDYDTMVSWGDDPDNDRYHMYIELCLGALHTFGEVVKCAIFDYVW